MRRHSAIIWSRNRSETLWIISCDGALAPQSDLKFARQLYHETKKAKRNQTNKRRRLDDRNLWPRLWVTPHDPACVAHRSAHQLVVRNTTPFG